MRGNPTLLLARMNSQSALRTCPLTVDSTEPMKFAIAGVHLELAILTLTPSGAMAEGAHLVAK